MKYSLEYIWECLNIIEPNATEKEKKSIIALEKNYEALTKAVSIDQAELLQKLQDATSNVIDTERKEAFIKGIKFATQFLFEASKE